LIQKTILVAPLHWGLGHATRCIPIIRALRENGYNVLLASDGGALMLLRKEFPDLESIELPSYNISYSKKAINFKWKLALKLPHIKRTMASEKKIVRSLVSEGKIQGIISDNRLGVRNSGVPSVFITHQLNVLTGNTSFLTSKLHQNIIKKFDQCWVPDIEGLNNLSGRLGHLFTTKLHIKYIGPLSRFTKKVLPIKYDVLALLSGPEPQRSYFEEKLMETFKASDKKVLLVRGVVEAKQTEQKLENITVVNFMQSAELEIAINQSEIVVARSGYTTILDLALLEKKAYFVPTPGQYEQKYLAKRLKSQGIVPSCNQENFKLSRLNEISLYKGLSDYNAPTDFKDLFRLFEGE
jgi:UDP:flavonoid glycosyltransferase YjiC (YdhE family)